MDGFLDSNLSRVVSASVIAATSIGITACVCIISSIGVTTSVSVSACICVTTGVSIVAATCVVTASLSVIAGVYIATSVSVVTAACVVTATCVIAAALVRTSLGIVAATSVVTTSIITATSNNSHIVSFTTTRGITLLHGAGQQVNADLITNVRCSTTLHLVCAREGQLSGEVTVSIGLDVQPHTSAVTLLTLKGSVLRRSQGTTIELNSDHRTASTILSLETLTTDLQRLTNLPLLRNVHLGTIIVGVNIYFTNYVIATLVGVSLVATLVRVGLVSTLVRVGLVATLVRVGLVTALVRVGLVTALVRVGLVSTLVRVGLVSTLVGVSLVVINRGGGGSTTVRLLACARRLASALNLKGDGVHNNQRTGVLAISEELTAGERHITDNIELTGGGLQIDSLHHCTSLQVNNSHIAVA